MKKILVINGANLNMLGIREPSIYGSETYADLENYINESAQELGVEVQIFQSNHEGEIVDKIQQAYQKVDGLVVNAGAYTHTSIAIMDAIKSVQIETVEVHISDLMAREAFRQMSYISLVAVKKIMGQGFEGYKMALEYFAQKQG